MPTTIVKTIGSGGDYATPALWEAAAPADLVAADQIWEGQILSGNNFSDANIVVTLAGSTSDATRYKHLTTASGASFQDHANASTNPIFVDSTKGATLTSTGNYGDAAIVLTEAYSKVSKLQLAATSGSGNRNLAFNAGNNTFVESCLCESYKNSATSGAARSAGATIRNTLIVQRGSSAQSVLVTTGSSLTTTLDNCTLIALNGCTNHVRREYSILLIRNSALFGATNIHGGSGGSVSGSSANNYTSATAATGFTNIAFGSAGFVSTTNDFRITSGSALKDAGATLSGITTDVMGTARPQGSAYDVGAHEYAVSSGSTITADAGSYSLTGQDVSFIYDSGSSAFSIAADAGSYLITGSEAYSDFGMGADFGTYSITGIDATFNVAGSSNPTISIETGYYYLNGNDSQFLINGELPFTYGAMKKRAPIKKVFDPFEDSIEDSI